jgi:hypothetical protein
VDVTIRADELDPKPCAIGIELLDGVVLAGTSEEILSALQGVAEWLGVCGADVALRDPGPDEPVISVQQYVGEAWTQEIRRINNDAVMHQDNDAIFGLAPPNNVPADTPAILVGDRWHPLSAFRRYP